MSKSFSAQVDEIVAKTEERMLALQRESIQRTVDLAQLPVAKGGRMRIDTGFLRASGQGSLSGMPTGPARGASKEKHFYDNGSGETVILELSKMQFGATFFFGWSAAYARYREVYDGFLEYAVQQWPQTVAAVAAEIRARIK